MKPHHRLPIIRKTIKWGAVLVMLFLGMFVSGCKGPSYLAKYGSAFDSARRSKGIAVVPSGWTVEDSSKAIVWYRPNWDGKSGGYQSKSVGINNDGSIREETDVFYSGKSFHDVVEGGMTPEKVYMTYEYSPRVPGKNWRILAVVAPVGREPTASDSGGRLLTIEEADGLLESWGIKRVAPPTSGG